MKRGIHFADHGGFVTRAATVTWAEEEREAMTR